MITFPDVKLMYKIPYPVIILFMFYKKATLLPSTCSYFYKKNGHISYLKFMPSSVCSDECCLYVCRCSNPTEHILLLAMTRTMTKRKRNLFGSAYRLRFILFHVRPSIKSQRKRERADGEIVYCNGKVLLFSCNGNIITCKDIKHGRERPALKLKLKAEDKFKAEAQAEAAREN